MTWLSAGAALLRHWRLLLALLLAGGWWATAQALERARNDYSALQAAHAAAAHESARKGAQTGVEAVTRYVDRIEIDRPVVERVVTRIVRQCADVPVSATAGAADASAAGAGDDPGRAFADAIGRDIAVCSDELTRLRELQRWILANSDS